MALSLGPGKAHCVTKNSEPAGLPTAFFAAHLCDDHSLPILFMTSAYRLPIYFLFLSSSPTEDPTLILILLLLWA